MTHALNTFLAWALLGGFMYSAGRALWDSGFWL